MRHSAVRDGVAPVVRSARDDDLDEILALNVTFEHFLSVLDRSTLERLHAAATYHRVIEQDGELAGFLLAFGSRDRYGGENFGWFVERYETFIYVDRIVVAEHHSGRGFGRLLYEDLMAFARDRGIGQITCEYDIDPPNPASARFHAAFGFAEVGQRLLDTGKRVSMQRLVLDATPP